MHHINTSIVPLVAKEIKHVWADVLQISILVELQLSVEVGDRSIQSLISIAYCSAKVARLTIVCEWQVS